MSITNWIGNRLRGTVFYHPARRVYSFLNSGVEADDYDEGFYEIEPTTTGASSFEMWLPVNGVPQVRQLQGDLEKPVIDTLIENIGSDDCFWNIGAAWGYYSLAAAEVAEQVVAFESDDYRATKLEQSINRNGFNNIDIIEGIVGEDVELDDLSPPDLVLMDVEGWEYEILKSSPKTVESGATWIVEMHDERSPITPGSPEINPDGVIEIFKQNQYELSTIYEREGHYFILASQN